MKINPKIIRWILCCTLVTAAVFDLFTYFLHSKYNLFEINALYIWTKSIWVPILLKIAVIAGLCYLISRLYLSDFKRFVWVLLAVYLIFTQIIGGISNLQTAKAQPTPDMVLEPSAAVKTYINYQIIWVYFPVIMALIAFKTWELCYDYHLN